MRKLFLNKYKTSALPPFFSSGEKLTDSGYEALSSNGSGHYETFASYTLSYSLTARNLPYITKRLSGFLSPLFRSARLSNSS